VKTKEIEVARIKCSSIFEDEANEKEGHNREVSGSFAPTPRSLRKNRTFLRLKYRTEGVEAKMQA
jgi:hypothetical protein